MTTNVNMQPEGGGYICQIPDCGATLDTLSALGAHITDHAAVAQNENVDPKSTP